jgi:hypothetical protein
MFDNEKVHAEKLQLPRVTVIEKLGEFRGAYVPHHDGAGYGNPERSLLNGLCDVEHSVSRNVQRLRVAEPVPIIPDQRPASFFGLSGEDEEIVHPCAKA